MAQQLVPSAMKYGPKHIANIRSSLQFAFNSSTMRAPSTIRTLDSAKALEHLSGLSKQYEMRYMIQTDQAKLSLSDNAGKPANSPYGAWMNLALPIGDNQKLRQQYQMFD